MFLQLFSKKTYPVKISKQNHVSHCCYRKREQGDGAIGLHGYDHEKRPRVRERANTGTHEQQPRSEVQHQMQKGRGEHDR